MFDIGFWEIALILVIMLIVVGPERLPGVARTLGMWIRKAQRMVAEVKAEVDRELQLEELKRSIRQQTDLEDLKQLAREVKSIESDVRKEQHGMETAIRAAWVDEESDPRAKPLATPPIGSTRTEGNPATGNASKEDSGTKGNIQAKTGESRELDDHERPTAASVKQPSSSRLS